MRGKLRMAVPMLAGALLLGLVPTASADPAYPTQQQVDAARSAVTSQASRIGEIEAQLAQARDALAKVQQSAEVAVEAYNGAMYKLGIAKDAATAATERADASEKSLEAQRQQLGRLAADSYRTGGNLATVTMVLDDAGPAGIIDRLNLIGALSSDYGDVYDRYDGAKIANDVLRKQADEAVATAARLADVATDARDQAQAAVDAQTQQTKTIETTQSGLITQLATLRGVAVGLERQRQAGIDAAAEASKPPVQDPVRPPSTPTATPTSSPTTSPTTPPTTHPPTHPPTTPPPTHQPTTPPPTSPPPTQPPPPPPPGAQAVIAFARAQIGKWYEWGADGPDTYDCSGLTMRSWEQAGKYLGHWSVGQWMETTQVPVSDMRPGDLLFWASGGSYTSIYHVALYVGNGQMIEAPHTGAQVRQVPIRWSGLFGVTRVS